MRYQLMPYIYAQAKDCTERGLPMLRALFVEYPDDPGAWLVDDQYLFGSDMLVAPMFEKGTERTVYLPGKQQWVDYQTGQVYEPGWQTIKTAAMPIIVLVRSGAIIPHIKLAQSTMQMDWINLQLVSYATNGKTANGLVCLPSDNVLHKVSLTGTTLDSDPLNGAVKWKIRKYSDK